MSGGAGHSTDAAPVVAADAEYDMRELVGDQEALREVEMGEGSDSGSDLTELESSVVRAMEAEGQEWERMDRGRPNFKRAAPGAGVWTTAEHAGILPARSPAQHGRTQHLRLAREDIQEGSARGSRALSRQRPPAAHSRWERRRP